MEKVILMTLLLWTISFNIAWAGHLPHFPVEKLDWHPCPAEYNYPSDFECAELAVPVDWNHPNGDTITLHINMAPATHPEKRIGSLIMNPGGPGGSASFDTAVFSEHPDRGWSSELRAHFDILGPDPRGVNRSTPIRCTPDLWNKRVSRFPKTEKAFNEMMQYFKEIGEDCQHQTGPLFNHTDTISVAHDMEAIRVALNEGPLNYLGFSYGTQLGSQYAELYPQNIRAMILDAVSDHGIPETPYAEDELRDYELVVNRFFDWAKTTEISPLYGQNVPKLFDDLIERANENPIPAPGCTQKPDDPKPCRPDVTGEELLFQFQFAVSDDFKYPVAAEFLSEALNGNATGLSASWYTGPTNQDYSEKGNVCQDWFHNSTWTEWQNRYNRLLSISPHVKGVSWTTNVLSACQSWPAPIVNPPKPLNITSISTNVLLVNALYDPQTPYKYAVSLQRAIEGSVLLTRDGDGHTSYTVHGDTQRAMDDYLINLTVPEHGTILDS